MNSSKLEYEMEEVSIGNVVLHSHGWWYARARTSHVASRKGVCCVIDQ
jgi:hypothetical protein